ncbi:two-component sensor histidine kinase [Paenibacillus sp. FSL H8-0548]|uniref:cache domain-containing sensor histidine kinase n=1 Tax=Paenibacillus sp. FSL H8-0548 TaxID=1920422 RepID=UPI00096EB060|nr:sensor histidine kinase [Paenibacillus sp. FSL H8-0548]OMF29418.1 two-component sensor histidine kinase [Paenibacillus sp. FSL H8-0548]
MKTWRQKWNSVFVKFSVSFILVGLIPLFALSYFSVQTFTGHVQRYTTDNLRQMVLYISYNLNSAFNNYNEISMLMYTGRYEGMLNSFDDNQTRNVNELEQINSVPIDAFLKMIMFSDRYISSAYFVRTKDSKLYYQTKENKVVISEKLPLKEWLDTMKDQPNELMIYPTHDDYYIFNSVDKVITIGRNLIDTSGTLTKTPKIVGTLFFDVDAKVADQFLRELNLGDQDELYVLDDQERPYFSNKELAAIQTPFHHETDDSKLILSEEIPVIKGQLLVKFENKEIYKQLGTTSTAVYIAIGISTLVLIIMGTWFSRRLAAPIRALIKQMSKVESGNLEIQIEVKSNDEMGRLAHGFNRMVDRLKEFINEAYVAEIKQKQTELNALKSQIRPHYLYNTLEVIRMNAVHSDADEVADMILSLSNQLKYVIDYGEDWVTIGQELEHLKDYFYIIEVRFENRFELQYDISDDIQMEWSILKLSLQPIVENAIQHGLRPKGKGTVKVWIEVMEDKLAVTVYDDGVGMEKEELDRLNRMLEDAAAPSKNVGVKNVHERIKSVCGEGYGISISSRKHVGTSVLMLFPVKEGLPHDTNHTSR